jgi:peptidoglycan/xylan/chitin deacetylase (PgdA/CDA1 family)
MKLYNCDFKWPDGAYIAVVINSSWEVWPKTLGTFGDNQGTGRTVSKDAEYGRAMMGVYLHAYAETSGMQRLLDLWERHDVKASIYVDGLTIENYPGLAKEAFEAGHEFIAQGWDHSYLWEQTVEEQAESIDKTLESHTKLFGQAPSGFSSAGGTMTPETFDLVADRGFVYACGFRNTDVPFIIKMQDGRKLVGMNSYALSDFDSLTRSDHSIREVVRMWQESFDAMYAEGARGYPQMLAYGTHPFLAHGFRTRPLEDLIRYVKGHPRVWLTTRDQIAQWMLEAYPDRTLADFYPEAVAQDRWYGLSTGAGGAEARTEALHYRKSR